MSMREKNDERWRERNEGVTGGPGVHDDVTRYGRSSEYGANFRDDSIYRGNEYDTRNRTVSDYFRNESPHGSEHPHRPEHGASMMEKVGRFFGVGPKGYKRSDQRIQEDVSDALMDDPFIDATHIEVTVKDGEVMLEGWVDDRTTKRRTEDVAGAARGVRDVHNHLRIRPLSQSTVGAVLGQPESKDRSIS